MNCIHKHYQINAHDILTRKSKAHTRKCLTKRKNLSQFHLKPSRDLSLSQYIKLTLWFLSFSLWQHHVFSLYMPHKPYQTKPTLTIIWLEIHEFKSQHFCCELKWIQITTKMLHFVMWQSICWPMRRFSFIFVIDCTSTYRDASIVQSWQTRNWTRKTRIMDINYFQILYE